MQKGKNFMNIGMIILGVILIVSVYGGLNYYIGRRIFQGLTFLFPHINGKIYAVAYSFIALTFVLGRLPLPSVIKGIMNWIGSIWIGVFVYLLLFFLVADLLMTLGSITKIIPNPMQQNIRFFAGLIVVLLTTSLVGYGIYNTYQTKYVPYDVQLDKCITDDMKIVLISDLHLGDTNSEKRLESIVQGINNQSPDIVCIVGDIFNDDYYNIRNPDKASAFLKSIKTTYGVYASLGNHDGGGSLNEMMNFLERSDVILLNDEHVIIDDRLILIGRLDSSPIGGFGELSRKDFSEVMTQVDVNLPVVVMDHNPANIDQYSREVDLIFAGHSHKGQIFPANLITNAIYTVDYGHYQKDADSPHVIVTSGVSTWGMPMRIGTNNEIVSILLR